jgi:5-formyltetrahydrofolate cyclo-ligase
VNNPIRQEKSRLRAQLQEADLHVSSDRAEASAMICERLRQQIVWQEARSVLFFAPMAGEPDVWPLLSEALKAGKQIALPRYSREGDSYLPYRVSDLIRDVRMGHYGIREPVPGCLSLELNLLDLTLVPGVGFGINGGRLGRGKGYYDRLLAGIQGRKCGVAFDWQVVSEIPVEPHDVCLDYIVTPTRWHCRGAGSGS